MFKFMLVRTEKMPGTDLVGTVISRHKTLAAAWRKNRSIQPASGYVPTVIVSVSPSINSELFLIGDVVNERGEGKTWARLDESQVDEIIELSLTGGRS